VRGQAGRDDGGHDYSAKRRRKTRRIR
jgi:hypothetical protein